LMLLMMELIDNVNSNNSISNWLVIYSLNALLGLGTILRYVIYNIVLTFNLNWIPRSRLRGSTNCRIQGLFIFDAVLSFSWLADSTILCCYWNEVSIFYIEFHVSLQLWSNYWHFVDCLWFLVILLVYS
jgi:hypothetical protein